jgi:hypothetical protein
MSAQSIEGIVLNPHSIPACYMQAFYDALTATPAPAAAFPLAAMTPAQAASTPRARDSPAQELPAQELPAQELPAQEDTTTPVTVTIVAVVAAVLVVSLLLAFALFKYRKWKAAGKARANGMTPVRFCDCPLPALFTDYFHFRAKCGGTYLVHGKMPLSDEPRSAPQLLFSASAYSLQA